MMYGGCLCGSIRYAADSVPFQETLCHCTICRRASGAPFVAWFTVAAASFQFVSGEPATFRSSEHGTRTFCGRCGTPLTFRSSRTPEEVDVTAGSLDDPQIVPPKDHTHTSSKLSWVHCPDGLPAFPGSRTSEND